MKSKIVRSEAWNAMEGLVWDEFHDVMHHGVIVLSREEMTNLFMNLLVEFMRFKRQRKAKRAEL